MNPLRFCMVTTFYPPYNFGGDGITVQRFARALVRRGHSVTVIHDEDAYLALAPDGPPEEVPEADGVEVIGLRSRLGVLSPLLTQQTGRPVIHGRRIRRLLESGRYDVIHFHNVSLVGGPGILDSGTAIKLYTAHEHWLVCPTHVLWRHGREPCPARECVRCMLRTRRPPQVWRATGLLEQQTAHVDTFFALSEFSRDKHREMGFRPEMEVLPPFLPADNALPPQAPTRSPHEKPYFLFMGRLERMKGLDELIAAFREYSGADLLIAGEGSNEEALRSLASGASRIRFLGRLNAGDLQRYLRHTLALIVPSVGYETFGIVLIEAFRAGVPVIARRLGPFPEIVECCRGGELFATREELLAAMQRLQNDASHRAACAAAAYQGYLERWSEDVVIPRYLDSIERARSAKLEAGRIVPAAERRAM